MLMTDNLIFLKVEKNASDEFLNIKVDKEIK